ncbi:MAG: DUF4388 domain-containing protein [Anaerolineales bacterium]|nr:DUF4388 domain-containing protein [Anaerolineales bacterium]
MAIQGNLQDMDLPGLLQAVAQAETLTCLQFQQANKRAVLFVNGRELHHAELLVKDGQENTRRKGEEVFYELLTWNSGEFTVNRNVSIPERTLDVSWEFLLMEGLRQLDEGIVSDLDDEDAEESLSEMLLDLSEDDAAAIREMMALQENNDMASKSEQLRSILDSVVNNSSDIAGAAIVDNDGLLLASIFNSSVDGNRVAAVSAGLISLASRSAQQLNQGAVKQTLIQAEQGNIIAIRANPTTSFVALTPVDVNLGMAFMECRDAAKSIGDML